LTDRDGFHVRGQVQSSVAEFRGKGPIEVPKLESLGSEMVEKKPTPGLEPGTPSLRV